MKTLSLLSSLTVDKPKPIVTESTETATRQYQVYLLDTKEGRAKIAVPVEMVEAFDLYVEGNPDKLASINEHLATFEAVIVE